MQGRSYTFLQITFVIFVHKKNIHSMNIKVLNISDEILETLKQSIWKTSQTVLKTFLILCFKEIYKSFKMFSYF